MKRPLKDISGYVDLDETTPIGEQSLGISDADAKRLKVNLHQWVYNQVLYKQKKPKVVKPLSKQNLILRVREQIVILRYGALGRCGDLHHTIPEISKITHVPFTTVIKVL